MSEAVLPRIWTPKELAEYLKVTEEVLLDELERGNLRGFKIGAEWRCSETDVVRYVSGGKSTTEVYKGKSVEMDAPSEMTMVSDFSEIGAFDFGWPSPGGQSVEHFERGYETTRQVDGQTLTFKIGFGERKAAGRMRPRVVVWLGGRALVEFAGGNSYAKDGLLASVIKTRNGKQVGLIQRVPPEYLDFRIKRYDSVVHGPYASTNLGIVVHKDDLESMLKHAIIRATWKGLL